MNYKAHIHESITTLQLLVVPNKWDNVHHVIVHLYYFKILIAKFIHRKNSQLKTQAYREIASTIS